MPPAGARRHYTDRPSVPSSSLVVRLPLVSWRGAARHLDSTSDSRAAANYCSSSGIRSTYPTRAPPTRHMTRRSGTIRRVAVAPSSCRAAVCRGSTFVAASTLLVVGCLGVGRRSGETALTLEPGLLWV